MVMATDPLVPRSADPATSYAFKDKVMSQRDKLFFCAVQLYRFTDSELRDQYEHTFETRIDRGVVARTRLALERLGKLDRLPLKADDHEVRFQVRR